VLTFFLQCAVTALLVTTAVLCLRIPAGSLNPFYDASWRLTGVALLLHSSDKLLQNVFGGAAMLAGSGSPVMAAYLRAAPLFNHSRTFLLDGYFVALVVLALYPRKPDAFFWRVAAAALALGFAAGVGLGWGEGSLLESAHYTTVALWDVVELLVLMGSLFIVLLKDRADRYLWALWSAYGLSLALGIFWFMVLAQVRIAGAWVPPAWTVHAMRVMSCAIMLGSVALRLRRARAGVATRGMLEPAEVRLSMMH
jgi:hypothetical protein